MKRILPLLLLSLLAACRQSLAPPAAAPAADLDAPYRAAASSGSPVYAVDPAASLVAVTVRSAGPMARLGHDHVVASRTLSGYAAPAAGRADLSFRLDQMTVDEPQLLREAGIATRPSPQAVKGTRKNMLGPALDAERYPTVLLHAQKMADGRLHVDVTLHGVTRSLPLPAEIQVSEMELSAAGAARLKQTDFGIAPFSVGAGLLAVGDEIEVRYHIVARRWRPDANHPS